MTGPSLARHKHKHTLKTRSRRSMVKWLQHSHVEDDEMTESAEDVHQHGVVGRSEVPDELAPNRLVLKFVIRDAQVGRDAVRREDAGQLA